MKTKLFRLLTVLFTAVMLVALSLNVMAAKSNAVTQDALTAQLFTDKDAYKAGESVKASVQVDNHTGREVFIFTQINVPESVKLAGDTTAFDARLQDGESWTTPGGVTLSAGDVAAAGATATGDNMQAGFYVILTALAVGGIMALLMYGKNRKTWLSVLLCLAMVGGMVVAAVPAQAADMNGDIQLSCAIQVDGKDTELSATVSYVIYDEAEETEESTVTSTAAPGATEAPVETESPVATETPVETETPTQTPSEAPTTAPTEEPTPTPTVVPTEEPTPTPTVPPTEQPTQEPITAVEEIYVSASATVGEGDGTINNPFANIGEAQALIRKINEADAYPANGITVYFRVGEYRIDEKLTFEAIDSGKEGAPVVYTAYQDEAVVFIGGVDIELSEFSAIDQTITGRLVEGAAAHIKQFDLKSLGLSLEDLGEMNLYGGGLDYFGLAGVKVPETQAPELFFNGVTMNIAKYPNTGWLYISTVIDAGDVVQNWTTAAEGDKYVQPEDRPAVPRGSTFTVDDATKTRMGRWTQANDPWVYGYWRETWNDQSMPVASMDASTGTVITDIPSAKEMRAGKYFYFYNLLEELDVEGEYFIDRDSGILYFYPPADASSGTVSLSLLGADMVRMASGTHDITFTGIEFKAGRVTAFSASGAERINITDCSINKFGNVGIYLKDCKDVAVKGCHLYELGTGGINVNYSTSSAVGSDMLANLTSSGIIVENCEINNFSRIKQTYSPAVKMAGVGMIVRNCKIYDSTHMAIQFCSDNSMSNNSIIENNEIFDVLQTSTDSSVFYGGFAKEQMGIVIRNNYIHDITSSKGKDISVVYCDDTKDGVTVESNLIVNFKGKGIFLNGGWDNVVRNNIFVNVNEAVLLGAIGMRGNATYYSDVQTKYDVTNHAKYATFRQVQSYEAYQSYPHWSEKLEAVTTYNAPKYNLVENNIIINTASDTRVIASDSSWPVATMKEENTVKDSYEYSLSEVGFADIRNNAYTVENDSVVLNNGDFTLAADSVLYTDITGFTAFDFSKIGLKDGILEKAGPLGPLEKAEEESNVLCEDDFSGTSLYADGWNPMATANEPATGSGSSATISSTKQMAYTVTTKGTYTKDKYFTAYEDGKVSYEMDFMLKRNEATDIESKIIALGTNAAGGTHKSLVNIQIKYSATVGGMIFETYDGGQGSTRADGTYQSSTVCEESTPYRLKLVVDPATDTYDFYAGETQIFASRNLRKDAGDVIGLDGIRISAGKTSDVTGEGQQIEMYIDNLLIQKVTAKTDPKEDYLVEDYFTGASLSDSKWNTYNGNPNPTDTTSKATINSVDQMEYLVASKGALLKGKQFDAYDGKISYEMDLMLKTNGATDAETKLIVVGNNATPANGKSLLNIQITYKSGVGMVFGAYDGGTDRSGTVTYQSDVVCADGVWYNVKIVIDPVTDMYDLYVDDTKIFDGRYLRKDAGDVTGFTEIRVSAGRTSDAANTDGKQFEMYADNLIIKKETDIGTDLLSEHFNGESLSSDWSLLLNNAPSNYSLGINSAKQLEIALTSNGAINIDNTSFTANTGVTVYEMDFRVDRNGSTVLDPGVMIAMGEGKSLVNIKAYCDETNGKVFGAYDGSGENRAGKDHPTTKACEDGVTYKVMLVVDPGTDTYDLYIDGELIIDGSPLRYEVSSVNGIRIAATKKEGDNENTAKIYYDNLKIYTLE